MSGDDKEITRLKDEIARLKDANDSKDSIIVAQAVAIAEKDVIIAAQEKENVDIRYVSWLQERCLLLKSTRCCRLESMM